MSKLVKVDPHYYPNSDFGHWCPGCGYMHTISTTKKNASGAQWSFDGNFEKPSFSPSINYRVNTPDMKGYSSSAGTSICHYFIKAGKIQFLGDCTHSLKGQTVDLPDFPEGKNITCERV